MKSFIKMKGTRSQLYNLPVEGFLEVRIKSATQLDDGLWEVNAFADETAIAALQARGITVETLVSAEKLEAERSAINEHFRNNQDNNIA